MSGGHDKQWAAKSSMSRFGTFSTPSFAGVGEPYEDAQFSTPLPPTRIPTLQHASTHAAASPSSPPRAEGDSRTRGS